MQQSSAGPLQPLQEIDMNNQIQKQHIENQDPSLLLAQKAKSEFLKASPAGASLSAPGTCASSSSPVSPALRQQATYDDVSEDSSINRNN